MADQDDDCFIVNDVQTNPKSLTCTNIPKAFLDKTTAKQHFERFGAIHSFTLRPKRLTCIVEYETAEAAENAISDGYYFGDAMFEMDYTPKAAPAAAAAATASDYVDPDVQMELNAMGGGSSSERRSALRPEQSFYKKPEVKLLATKRSTIASAATIRQKRQPTDAVTPTTAISSPKQQQPIDAVAKNELESLMRKPAYTSEERYRILDARDKLIRLTTARMTDIKSVISIRGVCPDMCPEKERLMREATHHAATYELEENSKHVMNHSLAVKQYARSSADQEFPLAHELRPESVLQLTMSYLLQNIVDLCEDPDINLGDWFHFLWDRTRSIRKDISQQELCSQVAVGLVEQCTRLHIHCAARLVAEEPQVFDQKINSENLTKCLQTLKYLYHDLHLRNEQCPNEAEFRAYVVLLNLNDCQFFWEVKQFPHHILHSPEIRFAIQVYLAVETNNYVKFFKLVRETTYMNACILLRYFTQVRVQALNVMLKAYVPARPVTMSISYWTYCLAFEDFEQTAQFFEYYGLQTERDGDRVVLDRNAFVYPDVPFLLERAINVVEHKRTCSVGESLHGRRLPDDFAAVFARHQPHDSFDEAGYLVAEAWTADDQNYLRPPTPKHRTKLHHPFVEEPQPGAAARRMVEDSVVFKVPTAPTAAATTSSQQSKPLKSSIFSPISSKRDEIDGSEKRTRENLFSTAASAAPANSIFGKSVFGGESSAAAATTNSNIFSAVPSVFGQSAAQTTETPKQSFGLFASFPTTSATTAPTTTSNIFGSFQGDTFTKLSSTERTPTTNIFGVANDQLKAATIPVTSAATVTTTKSTNELRRIEGISPIECSGESSQMERERQQLKMFVEQNKVAQKHCDRLLDEFVSEHIATVVVNVVAEHEQRERDAEEILTDLLAEAIQYEMDAFLTEMIDTVNERLCRKYVAIWRRAVARIRQRREIIENTPIWMPVSTVCWEQSGQQTETLRMKQRYRGGRAADLMRGRRGATTATEQINVGAIVAGVMVGGSTRDDGALMRRRHYWKCVVSVPDSFECSRAHRLCKWMNRVFVRDGYGGAAENRDGPFYCQEYGGRDLSVGVCLRRLTGEKLIDEQGRNGSEAAAIGTDAILIFLEDTDNLAATQRRIQAITKCIGPAVPMAIVCHHPGNILDTQRLRTKLHVTDESIALWMCNGDNIDLTTLTQMCLQQLAAVINKLPRRHLCPLAVQSTTSLLMQCLANQFWNRIATSAQSNPGLQQVVRQPRAVLQIYNEAIDRLTEICLPDDAAAAAAEFAPELRRFVPKNVPDIPLGREYFPVDWKSTGRREAIRTFFERLKLNKPFSLDNVRSIEDVQQRMLAYARSVIGGDADRVGYQMIQSLMVCVERLSAVDDDVAFVMERFSWIEPLHHLTAALLNGTYNDMNGKLPPELVYNRDGLATFCSQPWWLTVTARGSPLAGVRVRPHDIGRAKVVGPNIFRIDSGDLTALLERGAELISAADRHIEQLHSDEHADRETSHGLNNSLWQQEHQSRVNKRILMSDQNDQGAAGAGGNGGAMSMAGRQTDILVAKRQRFNDRNDEFANGGVVDGNKMAEIMARATACADRAGKRIESFRRMATTTSEMSTTI